MNPARPGFESFAAFVAARQHALLRSARLVVGDQQIAEDLVQEALIKVAQRWDRLSTQRPEAYARRIVYRDALRQGARRRREALEPVPDAAYEASDPSLSVPLSLDLQNALLALTTKQRAVLILRYYDDLSEQTSAEILGVSVGTIKSQCSVALRRLRETVKDPSLLPAESPAEGNKHDQASFSRGT